MIKQKDFYVKEQKRSDRISQQCDLVEELSNEDLENVAGGALSNIGIWRPPISLYGIWPLYGMQPLYGIRPDSLLEPMNTG